MNAIALTAPIRCHHGIALVGGFDDSDVEHDGTGLRRGQSLVCDDEQAKARKRAQAHELQRQEQARSDARRAGERSSHATRLTHEQRATRYAAQNSGRRLTGRQIRRIAKESGRTIRIYYREVRAN